MGLPLGSTGQKQTSQRHCAAILPNPLLHRHLLRCAPQARLSFALGPIPTMTYADITIHDRNPVKRWLQRCRFSNALKILRDAQLGDLRPRVLDFGAGDGELVRQVANTMPIEAWVFEPTLSLMAEAREKLARLDSVVFLESLDSVEPELFDYVLLIGLRASTREGNS